MRVYYSDIFKEHQVASGHPESPRRLDYALDGVLQGGITPTRPNMREDVLDVLERVHERSYINYIKDLCNVGALTELDGDTWVSPKTCDAAILAVAAMLDAIDSGEHAYILARPPGHHAGKAGRALTAPTQGFCIFNTAASGAIYAEGVAVVDIDVHHGNGTQEILYDRDILYVSTHQDPLTLYPGTGFPDEVGRGRGEGYNVNVPMPPGLGDDGFKKILDEVVVPILRQYGPRRIIVSLGWDAHRDDPLADMGLTLAGYEYALRALASLNVPLVVLLEGGYNYDVIKRGSKMVVELLTGQDAKAPEESSESDHYAWGKLNKTLEDIRRIHSKFWAL
ncbi:histone deacetylase family protein [Thermoproteus tenax]|uniref:Histone deacetylase family enzyme n=1 Tax=Thermoproteus tenax (strain ATCC 35583 / DSM 2078 / JCM 9277 / NBRC 100435 / Kra 1) TaxID=768679 RepID=G4RQ05_THETK|nr:histone deacetylase family protein [Thermoproteus tenax]CCC81651.1 Histone deacetylase family enzyme [Thermoproteus tenax Kra 1]